MICHRECLAGQVVTLLASQGHQEPLVRFGKLDPQQ
jgi:hypothetical protein